MVKATACIQCRVTPHVKAVIRALAHDEGISESALIKRLLTMTLHGLKSVSDPMPEPDYRKTRPKRLTVRLDPNDGLLLKERSAARGVPAATYVAALIRSHLRTIVPLMKEERATLDRVVAQLSAVGRNLNQIARALHQGQRAEPGREDLHAMLKVCTSLRDHVKRLVIANEKSWAQGYGENGP